MATKARPKGSKSKMTISNVTAVGPTPLSFFQDNPTQFTWVDGNTSTGPGIELGTSTGLFQTTDQGKAGFTATIAGLAPGLKYEVWVFLGVFDGVAGSFEATLNKSPSAVFKDASLEAPPTGVMDGA